MGEDEGPQIVSEVDLGDEGADAADHEAIKDQDVEGEAAGWGEEGDLFDVHGDAANHGKQGDRDIVDHQAAGGDGFYTEDGDGPEFLGGADFGDEVASKDEGHKAVVLPGVPPADGTAEEEEKGGDRNVGPALLDDFWEAIAIEVNEITPFLPAGALVNLAVAA